MHKMMWFLAALCLAGCATAPAANSSAGAKGKGGKSAEPAWVANPRAVYAENQYVSAVGYGTDRDSAEKNAVSALIAVFGQSVSGDMTVSSRYSEAMKSGQVEISEDQSIDQSVKTSVDFDTLVGAEIKDTWYDGSKYTYAVAVMDKMKATVLYSGLIESNEATITKLIDIPAAEKNTMDAYARYDLAAELGDTNTTFLNVLSVISPATASAKRGGTRNGQDLRLECIRIAQTIPIAVKIANDRDGRIAAAFSSVVADAGFKTGGTGSRYVLSGSLALSEAVLANNTNKFARYLVDAKLTDTATGNVLLPYSISGREGHATTPEAENRAVRAAETKIKSDFKQALSAYLAQLSPK